MAEALPQAGLVDGQKTQLGLVKHGGQMKMLMAALMNSLNFGMSGNRETQIPIVPTSKGKS